MKLKFFIRGIGVGILFSSVVFFIFLSSYNKISDEEIIKRAKALGMVQADDGVGELDKLLAASKGEKNDITPVPTSTPTPDITEMPIEEEEFKVIFNEVIEEESDLPKMIEIEIEEGQGAKQIAKLLEEKGIISDYSDFNNYLKSLGYTKSILSGKFHISEGADYSEIIKILVFK